jgi:CubicO group peptidase (beta-lactamase class C family)
LDLTDRIDTAVDDAIGGGRIVGAVTLVARDGEIVYRKAAGWFDREAGTRMPPEAIFRLASVTKPLIAATALAMVERGLLGLDNNVHDHLPWFRPRMQDGREPRITIRQLLTHTSGLGYDLHDETAITSGLQDTDLSLEENFRRYAERIPLAFEPGTGWLYGVSIDVLGAVIAQLNGGTLHEAFVQYVAEPLGMEDTGFLLTDPSRLAVPYADGPPGLRRMGDPELVIKPDGQNVFSPGRIFNPRAFQSGGAGAVGTASDLLRFFEAIRNRGGTVLNPDIVAQASRTRSATCRASPALPDSGSAISERFCRPGGRRLAASPWLHSLGWRLRPPVVHRFHQWHHGHHVDEHADRGLRRDVSPERRPGDLRGLKHVCALPPGTSTASRRVKTCC